MRTNFARLAAKAVTFDNFYAGSMPCMPSGARCDTGRYNFLHRSWGPLEPYRRLRCRSCWAWAGS